MEYCCECGSLLIRTEDDKFVYYKCDCCDEGGFVISKELMVKVNTK